MTTLSVQTTNELTKGHKTMTTKTAPSYYVRIDTYWQSSADYFVGPYKSRDEAQAAIDEALGWTDGLCALVGNHAQNVRYGIRIWGVLNATEARKAGMNEELEPATYNILSEIPKDTDELKQLREWYTA